MLAAQQADEDRFLGVQAGLGLIVDDRRRAVDDLRGDLLTAVRGQLPTGVQGSLSGSLQAPPPEFRDATVITDYAGFLAKVFGGDKESGLGRENHKMALGHYQQTKNLLVSYSEDKLGFF